MALPFCGFTLFWDAGSWASGLIAFSYTPWVWFVLRRVMRGTANPFWGFVVGALAVTQGNPYGVLALVVVGLGAGARGTPRRRPHRSWAGVLKLVGVGACAALLLPLVYLPLLHTSDLTVRAFGALLGNTGKLQPAPGDLLQAQHTRPRAADPGDHRADGGARDLPRLVRGARCCRGCAGATLRGRLRPVAAPLAVSVVYLALVLAPSKLWMFRWPLRVSEYLYLAVVVLFARAAQPRAWPPRMCASGSSGRSSRSAYRRTSPGRTIPRPCTGSLAGTALVVVLTALALLASRLGAAAHAGPGRACSSSAPVSVSRCR